MQISKFIKATKSEEKYFQAITCVDKKVFIEQ